MTIPAGPHPFSSVIRPHAEEALAHLLAIPYPAAAQHRSYVCALTWQYPSDGAWMPPNIDFVAPACRAHGTVSPPELCCKEVHLVERRDRI
jgi:hypothetical protein